MERKGRSDEFWEEENFECFDGFYISKKKKKSFVLNDRALSRKEIETSIETLIGYIVFEEGRVYTQSVSMLICENRDRPRQVFFPFCSIEEQSGFRQGYKDTS